MRPFFFPQLMKYPVIALYFLLSWLSVCDAAVYQTTEEFLQETFEGSVPKPKILWMTKSIKEQATRILAHRVGFLRTRYWQLDGKTAWIIEEIGKIKPITVGVCVEHGKIQQIKVLAFRESRGWEVKHDFFTDQFFQAGLTENLDLDKPIDGISGATLSVRALTKIARLALLFDNGIKQ